jgi:GTP cyclohydrolase I|nr:MAG TPA: GTP cyclohydrolase I [Caudoviricetes sp.]
MKDGLNKEYWDTQLIKSMVPGEDPNVVIEKCVYNILLALGENPDRPGLVETPKRVRKAYQEIFSSIDKSNEKIAEENSKSFDIESNDLVTELHIPCYSMCEHHLLPMKLDISIGYLPKGKVLGLSKMARIADAVCRRPQLQERIGHDIADIMMKATGSEDVIVVISGEHYCMTMRGVKKPGTYTRTAAMRGKFDTDHALRQEFYNLIN